jgi:hypothetical protein
VVGGTSMAIQTVFSRREASFQNMNNVQDRQIMRKSIYLLSLCFSPFIWATFYFGRRPVLLADQNIDFVASGLWAVLFAAIIALGLSAIIVLFITNRSRLRAVLRPNMGRIIGCLVLAFITPLAFFGAMPITAGLGSVALFFERSWESIGLTFVYLGFAALWYPVSSLIVSGIKSYLIRFWLFSLMFWTVTSAHMLWSGLILHV